MRFPRLTMQPRNDGEQKDYGWPTENPPVGDTAWLFPVGLDQAVGLPAVLSVIRLLSHAAGLVPLYVLRGQEGDVKERAVDTWQWKLLHRRPGPPPQTRFHFKADLAAQFSGRGNVYVRKFVANGVRAREAGPRVAELFPLRADRVTPARRRGEIVFDDYTGDSGRPITRTTSEVTHIRSFSLDGGIEGLSPITAARLAVSAGLRRQEFETMHLANGIMPGMAFKWPATVDKEQAQAWIEDIENKHKGTRNAGKLIFVGGGAELVPIPISLEDAQFAESTKLTIAQAAGMYQIPLSFFVPATGTQHGPTPEDWRYFLTFALGPIMTAIADAFTADETLFPPDGEDLYVQAYTDALLSLDPLTKAAVHKSQIQTGERLVDELRADDGLGPLPPVPKDWTLEPGKVPQLTPVGGGANPLVSTDPIIDGGNV